MIFLWLKFQTGFVMSKSNNAEGILRLYQISYVAILPYQLVLLRRFVLFPPELYMEMKTS